MQILSAEIPKLGCGTDNLISALSVIRESKDVVDNIILLSDMMLSDGFIDLRDLKGSTIEYLKDYVQNVNPNLKVFSIDL